MFNQKKWIVLCVQGALILQLSGCELLAPLYQRPVAALPDAYSEKHDPVPKGLAISERWWEGYQDTELNQLVELALKNNHQLAKAIASIEQAEGYAKEVGSAALPNVGFNANGTRTRVTEAGAFPVFAANPRPNYTVQLSTSFEIDFWGKVRSARAAAAAQLLSSEYARDTVALTLTSSVVNNYLLIRSIDTQLLTMKTLQKNREDSLDLAQKRLEGGVASTLDVHQAESAKANLLAQMSELSRQRSLLEHQLGLLTGNLDNHVTAPASPVLPQVTMPSVGLPSDLLNARPDIQQAEQTLIAANANIGVAKAALYPSITLAAGYGAESLEFSDIMKTAARVWNVGLGLYLPIFSAGKLDAKVDQVTAQQKQALHTYAYTVQTAFTEVNDALSNLREYQKRAAYLSEAATAADKATMVAENRYKAGYSAYLDVLDTQRTYQEAKLSLLQVQADYQLSLVTLIKALGGGFTTKVKDVNQTKTTTQ